MIRRFLRWWRGQGTPAEASPEWLERKHGARRGLRALYPIEAANTPRDAKNHWTNTTEADADEYIQGASPILRQRARYEIANNPHAAGICKTYANDTVGSYGPTLQIQSEDEEFNRELEDIWAEWMPDSDLGGNLHLTDRLRQDEWQFWMCGEDFTQLSFERSARTPITLRLLAIEPDRVDTPAGFQFDPGVRLGVKVDANGKPTGYYILKGYPGRFILSPTGSKLYVTGMNPENYELVSADWVIHDFDQVRPGLHRGTPRISTALSTYAKLRDTINDVADAYRAAAMFSVLIYTDHPTLDGPFRSETLDTMDLESMTMSMVPEGWKAAQIKPEHPHTQFQDWRRSMLSDAGAGEAVPYLKVGHDASGHNYSSARVDLESYWTGIESRRGQKERTKLNRVLGLVHSEASLKRMLRPAPARWSAMWIWPPRPEVDPLKAARAMEVRLTTGASTLASEIRRQGGKQDFRGHIDQLAREQEYAASKGITLPYLNGSAATVEEQTVQDVADESEEDAA